MKKEIITKQIIEQLRMNSFEFGKAGNRFKVYYDTEEELIERIKNAKAGETFLKQLEFQSEIPI